jgi:hypothetical protein
MKRMPTPHELLNCLIPPAFSANRSTRPYRGLRCTAVSTLVNDPNNDGPECL